MAAMPVGNVWSAIVVLPEWVRWALLGAAVLSPVALTVLLLFIARRSRWPDRR